MPKGIQISFEMAEICNQNGSKGCLSCSVATFFYVFPNYIVVLETSQYQNTILCQRASKTVSKWLRYFTKTVKMIFFMQRFHIFLFSQILLFYNHPGTQRQLCAKGRPSGIRNGREKRVQTNTQTHISGFIYCIDMPLFMPCVLIICLEVIPHASS